MPCVQQLFRTSVVRPAAWPFGDLMVPLWCLLCGPVFAVPQMFSFSCVATVGPGRCVPGCAVPVTAYCLTFFVPFGAASYEVSGW